MQKDVYSKKESEVKELVDRIKAAKAVVTFDYQGLTAEQFNELRSLLRKNGCECQVYKNNIARRAVESLNHSSLVEHLVGPKAMIFSNDDIIAPAKIIHGYAKKNSKLTVSVGIIENQAYDSKKIIELATMPSYEALLTMLAAGLLSPVRDITVGLHLLVEKLEETRA